MVSVRDTLNYQKNAEILPDVGNNRPFTHKDKYLDSTIQGIIFQECMELLPHNSPPL